MGMGATNTLDRVAASLGLLAGAELKFQAALDVTKAGVLLALPALLVTGLLRHTRNIFQLPRGYYRPDGLFLLLAFMALARFRSIESLRYCAPGEWGKLLGLDRIPEVRTLRKKIALFSTGDKPLQWSTQLCSDWMEANPEQATAFYVDGHVRVYHGSQTKLPRHYVARQKLCLRATTDYWVNAMDGQPFFLVSRPVDPGLVRVLEEEIVPRLTQEVPGQPDRQLLESDPLRHRFAVIFDREGYSPGLFERMKQQRIACLTYHKYPSEDWPVDEFSDCSVTLAGGEVSKMKLAERGVLFGRVWVREVRKLTDSGHQTSLLSTDYSSDLDRIAAAMFARWSQENFFRYMREHYALDRVIDHGTEEIPETTQVVNPAWRKLDGKVRSKAAQVACKEKEFGALMFEGELHPQKAEKYQRRKGELLEELAYTREELADLKAKRKAEKRHLPISQLPADQKFKQLSSQSKHFIDTIKMIAYRAETAMVSTLREKMSRNDDARSLLRSIYTSEADLLPNEKEATLLVRLHHQANRSNDEAIRHLCRELTSTETVFPNTNLRLVYELGASQNPRDQEV